MKSASFGVAAGDMDPSPRVSSLVRPSSRDVAVSENWSRARSSSGLFCYDTELTLDLAVTPAPCLRPDNTSSGQLVNPAPYLRPDHTSSGQLPQRESRRTDGRSPGQSECVSASSGQTVTPAPCRLDNTSPGQLPHLESRRTDGRSPGQSERVSTRSEQSPQLESRRKVTLSPGQSECVNASSGQTGTSAPGRLDNTSSGQVQHLESQRTIGRSPGQSERVYTSAGQMPQRRLAHLSSGQTGRVNMSPGLHSRRCACVNFGLPPGLLSATPGPPRASSSPAPATAETRRREDLNRRVSTPRPVSFDRRITPARGHGRATLLGFPRDGHATARRGDIDGAIERLIASSRPRSSSQPPN